MYLSIFFVIIWAASAVIWSRAYRRSKSKLDLVMTIICAGFSIGHIIRLFLETT